MTTNGLLASLGLLITLFGGAAASAQNRGSQPSGFIEKLIGNTLVYADPSQPGAERGVFLRLDGTGFAGRKGQPHSDPIRWAILSDGELCLYQEGQKPWEGDCGLLSLAVGRGGLTPNPGPRWEVSTLEGDAWHLDSRMRGVSRRHGASAINRLVGNTLVFRAIGSAEPDDTAFHFLAGGTLRSAINAAQDFHDWQLQPNESWAVQPADEALCLTRPKVAEKSCFEVMVYGDLVRLSDAQKGQALFATLLQGDAHFLSPEASALARAMGDQLVGRSIVLSAAARGAGSDSIIHFQADGMGRAQWGSTPFAAIKWVVKPGGILCTTPAQRHLQARDCAALSIKGDRIELSGPRRNPISGRLVEGHVRQK